MEGLTVIAFSMSLIGVTAFVFVILLKTRVDKLIGILKEKGILEESYKEE